MANESGEQSFLKSVKGKVIFGFLVGVIALASSYVISKGAFDEIEEMVSQISTPDEKLRLVNVAFEDILMLNQMQGDIQGAISGTGLRREMREGYEAYSGRLKARLDTLSEWFADSPGQLARLDTIRHMLDKRSEAFDAYVRERRGLVTNIDLKRKVNSISEIIATSAESKGDSTVIKTEQRTTTTTITNAPDTPGNMTPDQEVDDASKKGLWGKLFRGKKPREEEVISGPREASVIKKEEVKVLIDTLTIAKKDSTIQIVDKEIRDMARNQITRANRFLERERQLQLGETLLVGQLMEVMREVEADVLDSMYRDNAQVRQTIGKSIRNIGFILLGVLTLTALLGFWIFADITRSSEYRKELELAKEEADYHSEAKQRFLANMSHEIRTPLQSIIGFSELLKNEENPGRAQLEIIHKSSEHLLHLVNEILDYSRIISDSFEFAEDNFDIAKVLEEVVEAARLQASDKGLELRLVNEFGASTYVSGDAFRLKQILLNLLGNAIKFTKEGSVEMAAGLVERNNVKEIRLVVKDTGIGMKPDQVKRVFNQFEQGHAGIASEFGGSGLGLSIVKALVTAQGGRIEVDSKWGEYSSFTIHLPFKEGSSPIAEDQYEDLVDTHDAFDGGKVWIIDDDKYILQWLKTVLEQSGAEVRAFSSPIDADEASWDPEVSLVFIDIRMPGMSGTELCGRLKEKAGSSARFIACTAMALPDERARILQTGFDDLLMKPFRKSSVLRILNTSLRTSGGNENAHDADIIALAGADPGANTYDPGMIDISNLVSMTMGDEQLLRDSLEQFVGDTIEDLELVERHLSADDGRDSLRDLFHRLAGRTGQVGAGELGSRMRQLEVALAGDEPVSTDEIWDIVRSGYQLVEEIQARYVS